MFWLWMLIKVFIESCQNYEINLLEDNWFFLGRISKILCCLFDKNMKSNYLFQINIAIMSLIY